MSRRYDELVRTERGEASSDLEQFGQAAGEHFERAHQKSFGWRDQVRARREILGWSQRKLAKEADVPQADVSRLESGKGNPTLATFSRVTEALGMYLALVPQGARVVTYTVDGEPATMTEFTGSPTYKGVLPGLTKITDLLGDDLADSEAAMEAWAQMGDSTDQRAPRPPTAAKVPTGAKKPAIAKKLSQ